MATTTTSSEFAEGGADGKIQALNLSGYALACDSILPHSLRLLEAPLNKLLGGGGGASRSIKTAMRNPMGVNQSEYAA